MASTTPAHSPFSAAPSTSRCRKSPPHHHIILSPLTAKPTSKMPLIATSHRSLDIITCKATEVSQPSSLASASSGEDGRNWVPVVPLSALPKGERRVIIQDGETILLLWYKDDVIAIDNRSPAEGAYSEGLLNAKLTQDGCIVCPTTDSTFDLQTGEIKDWYPKNPVLRVLTPPLRTLFVYPVKSDGENIFISLGGGTKSDASTEIVFSGKAQPGFTATDVNVDEVRMVVDEDLEGFGFTGKNELINGRAAIIGFLVLLDFELLTGKGLLGGILNEAGPAHLIFSKRILKRLKEISQAAQTRKLRVFTFTRSSINRAPSPSVYVSQNNKLFSFINREQVCVSLVS